MEKINENSNVKEWYLKNYSNDDLGQEIDENITFYDIFYTLDRRKDVYNTIGVDDSIIRERIFEKLADVMQCDYNYIYEQWLLCTE